MNIKSFIYRKRINIAKFLMIGCIFLSVILFFSARVSALNFKVINSTYSGNSNNTEAKTIDGVYNTYPVGDTNRQLLPYIQGSGESNNDGVIFQLTNMYTNINDFTSFAVWEQSFSDSASEDFRDYDRWYIRSVDCTGMEPCLDFENLASDEYVVKDSEGNVITNSTTANIRYYIERSQSNVNKGSVNTIVDFSEFFTDAKVTYQYRIRNINYLTGGDGFGYKRIQVNFWKATDGVTPSTAYDIEFGLVRTIDAVAAHTNNTNDDTTQRTSVDNIKPVGCASHQDVICVDYSDTNGLPSASTIAPATVTVYLPTNTLYAHSYTTIEQVIANYTNDQVDLDYVDNNNTLYAFNYFCESAAELGLANIIYDSNNNHQAQCASGTVLRKYVYVGTTLAAGTKDINSLDNNGANVVRYDYDTKTFMDSRYQIEFKELIDAKGNYVVIIRDYFGNTNEFAVFKVQDIMNKSIIARFEKSNQTSGSVNISKADGWKANEHFTNDDVTVTITMTATTVIEKGLPIIAAEVTALDNSLVEEISYWRVDGNKFNEDICLDTYTYASESWNRCAKKPSSSQGGDRDFSSANVYRRVYYKASSASNVVSLDEYDSFVDNRFKLTIDSNGRYRFYIKLFNGNDTESNSSLGENKNPRLEVYKIDKQAPEIYFNYENGSNYCTPSNSDCSYKETTYRFYQGTGSVNASVIEEYYTNEEESFVIDYRINSIYYVNANSSEDDSSKKNPILLSSSATADEFYTYLYALFDSKSYLQENLAYYNGNLAEFANFTAISVNATRYNQTINSSSVSALFDHAGEGEYGSFEDAYRNYIIQNNIKYTSFAIGVSSDSGDSVLAAYVDKSFDSSVDVNEQNRVKIEYLDATQSDRTVCEMINSYKVDLNADEIVDQNDCVNYYLDHALNFKIRITVWDVIQDDNGHYVLGNSTTRTINVIVEDTTAPGFNKEIKYYNAGSYAISTECRIEIGNPISTIGQTFDDLLECYGITTISGASTTYNFEDNVFNEYTQTQTVNNRNHVEMYILSKEGNWINLKTTSFTPDRSGNYAILTIINDDAVTKNLDGTTSAKTTDLALLGNIYHDVRVNENITGISGNAIALISSYYVDKRIVLIEPENNKYKNYGESDPVFGYCVSVNKNSGNIKEYLNAPFANMEVFSHVGGESEDGCATGTDSVSLSENELRDLLKGNYGKVNFTGALTRQESASYYIALRYNASNNYINDNVGVYRVVLGSLTIGASDNDIGDDYIIKIDPRVRNGVNLTDSNGFETNGARHGNNSEGEGKYQLHYLSESNRDLSYLGSISNRKCNLVASQVYETNKIAGTAFTEGDTSLCTVNPYNFTEDDDFFVESNRIFTIRQVILNVSANGSTKVYGRTDPVGNKVLTGANAMISDLDGVNYLGGYTVNDLVNGDVASAVVRGTLRREVGEEVGVYSICNYRGTSYLDTLLEDYNNMLIIGKSNSEEYRNCGYFDEYINRVTIPGEKTYTNGILNLSGSDEDVENYIKSRSLYIVTNKVDNFYRITLNNTNSIRDNNYANYVINYVQSNFTITPETLYVQPTPGQRREYNYSGVDVVNPWEVVIYNVQEFTKCSESVNNCHFNGYTEDSLVYDFTNYPKDLQSVDTENPSWDQEHYNNASEVRTDWRLLENGITYTGRKASVDVQTSDSIKLFTGTISLTIPDTITISNGRYLNMQAGWYSFNALTGSDSDLAVAINSREQCQYSSYLTTVGDTLTGGCRNYDLKLDLNYRDEDGYKNGDVKDSQTVEVVYKSKLGYCKELVPGDGLASDSEIVCQGAQSSQILFEVYRREIILEFNSLLEKVPTIASDNDIVYGNRYDYYFRNLFAISSNKGNYFNADDTVRLENNATNENNLFYCYATFEDGETGAIWGDCSDNPWYGLTENDTWKNIGLEFKLHPYVSSTTSGYYCSSIDNDVCNRVDSAVPAGRYYVYASITDPNYKFNYLGGTLTIKTKSVGVEITSYSKEYGNVYYNEVDANSCKLKDGSFLNHSTSLINDCNVLANVDTNTYGFIIEGLDEKDTIVDNFVGRPRRESNLAHDANNQYSDFNGLQENVGRYQINVGTIHSISNNISSHNTGTCTDLFVGDLSNCIVVSSIDIHNYIISNDGAYVLPYYLYNNGKDAVNEENNYKSDAVATIVNDAGRTLIKGTLLIQPATISITVTPSQTKMYGCAYNSLNTTSIYRYSYNNAQGYFDCETGAGANYDFGYEYTVIGDKDYYIYNHGYYNSDYGFSYPYTISRYDELAEADVTNRLKDTSNTMHGIGRSSALNGGVLYRVKGTTLSDILYADLVSAANAGQAIDSGRRYQGQSVGSYLITLGNLNASLTSIYTEYKEANNKVCDSTNQPSSTGTEICRNYIISYYGNTSVDTNHNYSNVDSGSTTYSDLEFTITKRFAFIYTTYSSKVYGNEDPVVSREIDGVSVTQGLNAYDIKKTSLAKAPWIASIEESGKIAFNSSPATYDSEEDTITGTYDTHTQVVEGQLSRMGMHNGAKDIDDIVGTYNYLFSGVNTTRYSNNNYNLNFYLRNLSTATINGVETEYLTISRNGSSGNIEIDNDYILDVDNYNQYRGVNEDGGDEEEVSGVIKKILFEINLRKITITLIDFEKVYGVEDDAAFFEIAVCATGDEVFVFDEYGNARCVFKEGVTKTQHGLSSSHAALYYVNGATNKTLKQADFRNDFGVKFVRAKGENIACATLSEGICIDTYNETSVNNVNGTISGNFPSTDPHNDYDRTFAYNLDFTTNGYEAMAYIAQTESSNLGYNYEVTYVKGTMTIIPRTIRITPDENQGFQYGSYTQPSLIPAITFTNSLENHEYVNSSKKIYGYDVAGENTNIVVFDRTGNKSNVSLARSSGYQIITNGLVNNGTRVCLKNVDDINTFCIDDRQDTYAEGTNEQTTSSYAFNYAGVGNPTYVFGDTYTNETGTSRHALNRSISYNGITSADSRYNRNVGEYIITLGDLVDQSSHDLTGNYFIEFTGGVKYVITPAELTITPVAGQSKIYGEADKELKFNVTTRYITNRTQYVTCDSTIVSIDGSANSCTESSILVEAGKEIVLNGFAYYENSVYSDSDLVNNYNYGIIKNSTKNANSAAIGQRDSVVGKAFDKYCYDNYLTTSGKLARGNIDGCNNQNVQFELTTLVLIGYPYVDSYIQSVGEHNIVNGIVVADNEFGTKNYHLTFVENVKFEIIQLDITIEINSITKDYGVSTDAYKCDGGVDCHDGFALLTANDNQNMLEYNFDIYRGENKVEVSVDGHVLMVDAINNNYYTQTEGVEEKNTHLGIEVIRAKDNDTVCSLNTDIFGCEDAGVYLLYFRKVSVRDEVNRNYNLMVVQGSNVVNVNEIDVSDDVEEYVLVNSATHNAQSGITSLTIISNTRSTLTINRRVVSIYVNTNLNSTESRYYEIEQNIEVPTLPTVDSVTTSYNLTGYNYNAAKTYHSMSDSASTSTSAGLNSTYGHIVWGDKPHQVRTSDRLTGELAYCNQANNGSLYRNVYPNVNEICSSADVGGTAGSLVYAENKRLVNTNTTEEETGKFIIMTRDTNSSRGLKILTNGASPVDNNDYEDKNYDVSFYAGAVHIVKDSGNPVLVVGNKDYYIEANAKVGDKLLLEYLDDLNGAVYVLARVREDGTLYISVDASEIEITSDSLYRYYGNGNTSYPGIVSGVEQFAISPFVSDYAHVSTLIDTQPQSSYLNETNITSLQELITTFIKWFDVTSYDKGQVVNGEYLERKFDKYYYLAINRYGSDVVNNEYSTNLEDNSLNNEFRINKIGTYNIVFYVMDNAGNINEDNDSMTNMAKLHIIDTTAPSEGELTLYSALVKCDDDCNQKDQWYIAGSGTSGARIKLANFNRYRFVENVDGGYEITREDQVVKGNFVLDAAGDYIYLAEVGGETNPFKAISELTSKITIVDYVKYLDISEMKYSAEGIVHYSWASNDDGIFLTITGGSDNSYTDFTGNTNSQWSYYYSIDGGNYYVEYLVKDNMEAKRALYTDGVRTIYATTIDMGVDKIATSVRDSANYSICFDQGCNSVEIPYKVEIYGEEFSFNVGNINNRYFTITGEVCTISRSETYITCSNNPTMKIKLEGNAFTYGAGATRSKYFISGNNILDARGGYFATLNEYSVNLDGVSYDFDESAMKLYRHYYLTPVEINESEKVAYGDLGGYKIVTSSQQDGTRFKTYLIDSKNNVIRECKGTSLETANRFDCGNLSIGDINANNDNGLVGTFNPDETIIGLLGKNYRYYDDAISKNGFYKASEDFRVYQDQMTLGGTATIDIPTGESYAVDSHNSLVISRHNTYTTSYKLYDKYLLGIDESYNEPQGLRLDKEVIIFRTYLMNNVKWKQALESEAVEDEELTEYLNNANNTKYYRWQKIAYLDNTRPTIGIIMNAVIEGENRVIRYGEDWYVYEYGYENALSVSDNIYKIRTMTYTIHLDDINNRYVSDSNGNVYPIDEEDVYEINYTRYHLHFNEGQVEQVTWVNTYIEKYVGTKDTPSGINNAGAEVPTYDISASVFKGGVDDDTSNEEVLITNSTVINNSSGIGGSKYPRGASDTLFDFVNMNGDNTFENGIYYEDIEYIAWYDDGSANGTYKDLSEDFKQCYLTYGSVTQDCAQRAITNKIVPIDPESRTDMTYTINYVVRDKAGNASNYAARGVLYATILPSTNVITRDIEAGNENSGVSVTQIGTNEYGLTANQGVSLQLLSEAFKVDYSTTYRSYNNSAVMTIYKGDELLASNVSGVAFTNYIDSSEIADYKVVYSMNSIYKTYLNQIIDVSGEEIVLHISINAPKVEEDSVVTLESVVKNDSSFPLYAIVIGMLGLLVMGFVVLLLRKKR